MIRGEDFHELCAHMYGDQPDHWDEGLSGYARLRVIINAMTRMRVCAPDGKMDFRFKGMVKDIPDGYLPWFEAPNRASREATIIFGHWSALGLQLRNNLLALDTGCLWGGTLTAVRLDDRKVFQVPCGGQEATRRLQ
jgi:bis(5'-nucleosyl)-tetraphosphatase (symmetrical)